jgi:hypothetical protein
VARPALFGEPADERICIRVTLAQRRELEQVARDNSIGGGVAALIREAVNTYVSDYRDATVFRQTK